ncbi:MAG: AAA family ATPase [Candidatus Riflebacteria bacterium]|nr:AAA family ATPase [Candidatus Riflebacteria bacterium]
MKKLPIGIQNFSEIRKDNFYYVDKTNFVKRLFDNGKYYFLSRPRRFGKSLFVDTLKEAFSGNRELFRGLYLENNWDWAKKYPVINLSFGGGTLESKADLNKIISSRLNYQIAQEGLQVSEELVSELFRNLIIGLFRKYSLPVVILVDEYDKPILDNISNPEIAKEMRDGLRNLYSVIKDCDAYIRFAFLTGISKFSKVSIFSGLNNIVDISVDSEGAEICGYTYDELLSVFGRDLSEERIENIKTWYNGYNFLGKTVFNPFSVLLHLKTNTFKPFWFETANPRFLIDVLKSRNFFFPQADGIVVSELFLSQFDVDFIDIETLLFQTGYLTIDRIESETLGRTFRLKFPNLEVRLALNEFLLRYMSGVSTNQELIKSRLSQAFMTANAEVLETALKSLFAAIPHDWFRKNNIAEYEGFYASTVYSCLMACGFTIVCEDATNLGQIDMTLKFADKIFITEFKTTSSASKSSRVSNPLKQIRSKGYYEKYLNEGKQIYFLGMTFSKRLRNLQKLSLEAYP